MIYYPGSQNKIYIGKSAIKEFANPDANLEDILLAFTAFVLGPGAPKYKSKNITWTNYKFKHVAQKNLSWSVIRKSTKNGPAKYIKGIDYESLERDVWDEGIKVTNGKTWKVMEFDYVVGAKYGKHTKYVRVEWTEGTIHGHPITKDEFRKYTKQNKRRGFMFEDINFKNGKIVYNDFQIDPLLSFEKQADNLKEDMFQVEFLNNYTIDIGWYPCTTDINGNFIIYIIKEYNWEEPLLKASCRTIEELKQHLIKCVNIVESQLDTYE
ncbi:hypothetical protein VQL36_08825 [Chengkuizengella sp. SCS-71B]|uniref:hypothetical protein n=1 Tax=Chengkuizengella sp. SCS-71B TaxID=3115290 RepID=UPI0032C23409